MRPRQILKARVNAAITKAVFLEPGQHVDNRLEHQLKRVPTETDECKTNSMALFLTDTF